MRILELLIRALELAVFIAVLILIWPALWFVLHLFGN